MLGNKSISTDALIILSFSIFWKYGIRHYQLSRKWCVIYSRLNSLPNALIDLKTRNNLFIEGGIKWTTMMLSLVLAVAELPHLVFHPDTPTGGLWCLAQEAKPMWNNERGAEPPVHLRLGWLAGTPIPPLSDAPSIMLPTILHRPPQLPSILCPGRVLVNSYSNL